jgi:hypothetical protein
MIDGSSSDDFTLERMPSNPLIPPHEAPPAAWGKSNGKFKWRLAVLSAAVGGVIAVVAFLLHASAWWWLAIPAGLSVGYNIGSRSVNVPASWIHK